MRLWILSLLGLTPPLLLSATGAVIGGQDDGGSASMGVVTEVTEDTIQRHTEEKLKSYPNAHSCLAYDGHQIDSFDWARFRFRGLCEYILSRAPNEFDKCAYEVTILTERPYNSQISQTKAVNIRMNGREISLHRGSFVTINGMHKFTPLAIQDECSVVKNSQSLTFHSTCGLTVIFWNDDVVQVLIPESRRGIDGLCGNNDRISNNDYVTKEGRDVRTRPDRDLLVAHSYTVGFHRPSLPPACMGTYNKPDKLVCGFPEEEATAKTSCSVFLEKKGPFSECGDLHVPLARKFYDLCVISRCKRGRSFEGEGLCLLMSRMAEECWQRGVLLQHWREHTNCPLSCPANSHFTFFLPRCGPTCSTLENENQLIYTSVRGRCHTDTQAGCKCNTGYILGEEGCVKAEQCGCVHKLMHYIPMGTTFLNRACTKEYTCQLNSETGLQEVKTQFRVDGCGDGAQCVLHQGDRQCECKRGYEERKEGRGCFPVEGELEEAASAMSFHSEEIQDLMENSGECRAAGDPHYFTFDGSKIHFQGACTYILSRSTSTSLREECKFDVKVKNEYRNGRLGVSFTRNVYIETAGMQIFLMKGGSVMVNGLVRYPPFSHDGVTIAKTGQSVEVTTPCQVEVAFDGVHMVTLRVPIALGGELTGLCGNFNGDVTDDLVTSDGLNVRGNRDKYILIGNSYLTTNPESFLLDGQSEMDDGCLVETPVMQCSQEFLLEAQNTSYCGGLVDPDGVFGEYIYKVGSSAYSSYESCVMDVCAYYDQPDTIEKVICMAYHELASICEAWGFMVQWRTQDFCPIDCPEHATFQPLMSGCQPTCMNPNPLVEECKLVNTEGCQCEDNYIMDARHCIREEDCGCRDTEDNYIPRGHKMLSPDCTTVHECVASEMGSMFKIRDLGRQPCHKDAVCFNNVGDVNNPRCVCKEGFVGDGHNCSPREATAVLETLAVDLSDCTCSISGDPHVLTHDGAHLTLTEPCKYILSESEGDAPECAFRVEVKNERRPTSLHPLRSYVRLFDVKVGENLDKTVRLLKPDIVLVKGFPGHDDLESFWPVDLPWWSGDVHVEVLYGHWMTLTTGCGLQMAFDGRSTGNLTATSNYREIMTGLCGNCDGLPGDDLRFEGTSVRDFVKRDDGSNLFAEQFLTKDDSDIPDNSTVCMPSKP